MKNYNNYIKLSDKSLFKVTYAYLDVSEYLADALFIRHKVHVKHGMEFAKKGSDYRMILCKIRRTEEKGFLQALEELKNKMLLMGHTDYEQESTYILGDEMEAWKKKSK